MTMMKSKEKSLASAQKRIANLISRRFYSEHELRVRLKTYSEDIAETAIDWAKQQGFIDDERFCRAFIHDAALLNPVGKRLLYIKLSKKGIQGGLIENVLQKEYPKELEKELAFALARKYVNSLRIDDSMKKFNRLCGYLLRRGFPNELVYQVAKEVLSDLNLDT